VRFTRFALTAGFAATLFAAAPMTAIASAAELPTYTCFTDTPAPHIFPPWVHGIDCVASPGAPTSGPVDGPLKLVIEHPKFSSEDPRGARFICDHAQVHEGEAQNLRVMGMGCFPEKRDS
jgi:hypothetical protein